VAFQRPRLAWEKEPTEQFTFTWGDLLFSPGGVAVLGMTFGLGHSWAQLPHLGARSHTQYTGTDLETLSMSGVILLAGEDSFNKLRDAGQDIEPHSLTDSTGKVWGRYALTNISATVSQFYPNGKLRTAEWQLDFQQVPEDDSANNLIDENVQGGAET